MEETTVVDVPETATGKKSKGKVKTLNQILVKRDGRYFVQFEDIEIVPQNAVRDFNLPENDEHVEWLKAQIFGTETQEPQGVRDPIRGYYEDGKIKLTGGHSRHEAVRRAIEEELTGPDYEFPLTLEKPDTEPVDLAWSVMLSNTGKPFAPHEDALLMSRLHHLHGVELEEIAARHNPPMTVANVKNYLLLALATPAMAGWMRDGVISPTTCHRAINHYMPKNPDEKGRKQAVNNAEKALRLTIKAVKDSLGASGRVTEAAFKDVAKQLELPKVAEAAAEPVVSDNSGDTQGSLLDADDTDSAEDSNISVAHSSIGSNGTGSADGESEGASGNSEPTVEKPKRRTAAEKELAFELYDKITEFWADASVEKDGKETVMRFKTKDYNALNKLILGG